MKIGIGTQTPSQKLHVTWSGPIHRIRMIKLNNIFNKLTYEIHSNNRRI